MSTPEQAVWRIVRLPDWGPVDVTLMVDTHASAVLETIERSAAEAGLVLERVSPSPDLTTPK
jgi:hypothetical protein